MAQSRTVGVHTLSTFKTLKSSKIQLRANRHYVIISRSVDEGNGIYHLIMNQLFQFESNLLLLQLSVRGSRSPVFP
jgi:hypothetical protein